MTELATLTPTAIDAMVFIESVRIVGRHRYALGNLDELAKSIADVGLLNPITLTRDTRLVAGHRRLEACRRLGWSEIPARFIDSLDDAAKLLRAERDENTCRKEMLLSELASLGEALYELEERNARQRMAEAGRKSAPGRSAEKGVELVPHLSAETEQAKARDLVGEALGMSGRTYSDLRGVYLAATDPETPEPERVLAKAALDKMDRTGSVKPAAKEFRQQQRAKRDAQEAKAAALGDQPSATPVPPADERDDPDWVPPANDSSRKASTQRRGLIRSLAGQGWSSQQIGKHLGVLDVTVRRIARDEGITIRADEALGQRQRKIDSNRIVRETVATLDGLAMGLQLIAYDDLDPTEIENWATSLGDSIRLLTGLKKQLSNRMKEMTL